MAMDQSDCLILCKCIIIKNIRMATVVSVGPLLTIIITPRRACTARGQVIALGLDSAKKPQKYSLSVVHFNTRLLFEFNGLWYHFAVGQVFVAFVNPASVPFGKVSKHKHCQLQTIPPTVLDIRLNTLTTLLLLLCNLQHSLQL